MRKKLFAPIAVLGLVGVMLIHPASGQGTNNTPDSDVDFGDTGPNGGWGPIIPPPIEWDPGGPAWVKRLHSDPTWANTPLIAPSVPYLVDERIEIAGSNAWTDWHEHILTPGWIWVDIPVPPTVDVFDPALGSSPAVPAPGLQISPLPDPNIWFDFDPITRNKILLIEKYIVWNGVPGNSTWGDGQDDSGNIVPEDFIEVHEYPTVPEPTGIVLAALAVLGLVAHGRRRA